MALTIEQTSQLEYQKALDADRFDHEKLMESRRAKLEMVRLAKEILIENARSKPVDSREVLADDIKNYSQSLVNYINE